MSDQTDEEPPRKKPNYNANPLAGAPEYRKGAMKAAILQQRAAQAELIARPDPTIPVVSTGLRDLALKLGEKAMRVLEGDLADPDPRARQEAARALAAVCTKFAEMAPPVEAEPTEEEREAQLEAALSSPRLREFLESRGWEFKGVKP